MLAWGEWDLYYQGMYGNPRTEEMAELTMELRALEDRAFALSVYDYPEEMDMADMVLFALTVYDDPRREVDPEQLREVFTKCGQFGVVALDGTIDQKPPYLHLGKYYDSLESLQKGQIITIGEKMRLTGVGKQLGAALFSKVNTYHQPVTQ